MAAHKPQQQAPAADRDDEAAEMLRLAGGLAHEIKNPLSTISLNMELLAEDLEDVDAPGARRARRRIEVVRGECQRLQVLLDGFLDFARARPGQLQPGNLNTLIGEVLDFFEPDARQARIDVLRYLDPDLPSVLLDHQMLRGALLNLLINARQAMPHGGQLMVRTTHVGTKVQIYLIDTGCGMNDHTASRIFDVFYSTKVGGSGLGLPTTSKIIAAHGGRIHVESEVGQGTKFLIELPVPKRIAE